MFLMLFLVSLVLSSVVSGLVVLLFTRPISRILQRIISDDVSTAWLRYIQFAIFVVGISSGARVDELQQYLNSSGAPAAAISQLTPERWTFELYLTIMGALQGLAGILLLFFLVALIAFVFIRAAELRHARTIAAGDHA